MGTLSLISALVGCGEGPGLPITYETEHLRIGTDLEHPLCAGDLEAFERTVRRVEDELGFSMKGTFSVSIWSDQAWKGVKADYCDDHRALGCTSYRENAIYTTLPSVQHELVHAAIPIENLTPFFAEGLADVYGGRQTRFGSTAPAQSLELSGTEMDRVTAAHFVRWLRETWGGAKLGQLAKLGLHAGTRFAEVYGLSFADAQAMYFAEAPFGYPSLDTCAGAPIDSADGDGWRAVVAFDCEGGEQVRVYGIGLRVLLTFEIPVAGYYSVSTDAEGLTLSRCATGPIEEPVRADEFLGDDVPPSYELGPFSEAYALYEGEAVLDLYFEVGKHEIGLLLLGYGEGEANLSIRPSLGPRPVEVD